MIAMAIFMRWWRLVARSKAYNSRHQLGWSAADQVASNATQMAAPSAPLNLRRDSMATAEANQKPPY